MGDKINDEIINKVFEIATGKKSTIFWAIILIFLIFFILLYPYIDANYLFYSRIDKRIEILDKVTKLDTKQINSVPQLQEEYNSILNDIVISKEKSIGELTHRQQTEKEYKIKFISGGILFWIVALYMLFQKNKKLEISRIKNIINNFFGSLFCVAIGIILAYVGTSIPTIFNIWLNAIAFPILQIVITGLFVYSFPTKSKDKT